MGYKVAGKGHGALMDNAVPAITRASIPTTRPDRPGRYGLRTGVGSSVRRRADGSVRWVTFLTKCFVINMDEIKDRAKMQLRVVEQSYSINIQNKEDIARIIADKVSDKRHVLRICASLNYWVATNNIKGNVIIPLDVVLMTLERP